MSLKKLVDNILAIAHGINRTNVTTTTTTTTTPGGRLRFISALGFTMCHNLKSTFLYCLLHRIYYHAVRPSDRQTD